MITGDIEERLVRLKLPDDIWALIENEAYFFDRTIDDQASKYLQTAFKVAGVETRTEALISEISLND